MNNLIRYIYFIFVNISIYTFKYNNKKNDIIFKAYIEKTSEI